jgi:hypothetical protein
MGISARGEQAHLQRRQVSQPQGREEKGVVETTAEIAGARLV